MKKLIILALVALSTGGFAQKKQDTSYILENKYIKAIFTTRDTDNVFENRDKDSQLVCEIYSIRTSTEKVAIAFVPDSIHLSSQNIRELGEKEKSLKGHFEYLSNLWISFLSSRRSDQEFSIENNRMVILKKINDKFYWEGLFCYLILLVIFFSFISWGNEKVSQLMFSGVLTFLIIIIFIFSVNEIDTPKDFLKTWIVPLLMITAMACVKYWVIKKKQKAKRNSDNGQFA